jgi:hypothetical protein
VESKINDLRALLHYSEVENLLLQLVLDLLNELFAPDFLIFQINVINKNLIEIKVFGFHLFGVSNPHIHLLDLILTELVFFSQLSKL